MKESSSKEGVMSRPKAAQPLAEFFQSEAWLAWCKCESDGVRLSGKTAGLQRSIGRQTTDAARTAAKHHDVAGMADALLKMEASARAVVAAGPAFALGICPDEVFALTDAVRGVHSARFDSLKAAAGLEAK